MNHSHPTVYEQFHFALFKLSTLLLGLSALALMGYGVYREIHWAGFGLVLLMTALLGRMSMIEHPGKELPHHYLVTRDLVTRESPMKATPSSRIVS